jgi:hypothetical protein
MNVTTIPVSVTEEAARRVALLGAQRELDAMLEWTTDNVPDIRAIVVEPGNNRCGVLANLVVIMAYCTSDEKHSRTVPIEWDWACWKVQAIPLHICANFIMSCTFQPVPAA